MTGRLAAVKKLGNADLSKNESLDALLKTYRKPGEVVPTELEALTGYLLLLLCRKIGEITGGPIRDRRVILRLAEASPPSSWLGRLRPARLDEFPDQPDT